MADDDRRVLADLTMLADDLLEQAVAIRRQWVELGEALGVEVPDEEQLPAAAAQPRGDQSAGAGAGAVPANGQTGEDDPVRLVALDMMLSGRSREDIESYLQHTFGDAYRVQILDEVFDEYR
jgi:hypothetical protein